MEVKICGITRSKEVEYLTTDKGDKSDYAGFVIFEKSKRFISVEAAKKLIKELDGIVPVAVTVSPEAELIKKICDSGFGVLQVHKELTAEMIEASTIPIWYAFNVASPEELKTNKDFLNTLPSELASRIEGIVVDAAEYGSGKTFDWSIDIKNQAKDIFENRKFILAGGLNPENVTEGIKVFEPDIVDVSSGVEGLNGKEKTLVQKFIERVRDYE